MGYLHFRDPEMTPWRSSKVIVIADSETLGIEFPLVFLSNYGSISHRLGATGDYSYVWPLTLSARSLKLKGQGVLRPTTAWGTFLSIGTHRLRAMVLPAMSDFNFRDLEMTLKGHPRPKVMTHFNYVGHQEPFLLSSPMAYGQRFGRYGRFSLSWPWNDSLEVIQGQGHCAFWILGIQFLLVFLSNYGSIYHRLGAICDYSCTWPRSRTCPRKVTQGQRSRCTSTDQEMVNIFVNRHP